MAPIKINVTGSSTIHEPPERAVLTFQAQSEGAAADEVSRQVTSTANQLQQTLHELKTDTSTGTPPITTFKTSSMHSWTERPRDRDGNSKPHIYHAQVRFQATFHDFKKLGSVAGHLAALPTVGISNITWQLTPETERRLSTHTRKSAMKDAIEKAEELASVVGRAVEPVDVSNSDGGSGYYPGNRKRAPALRCMYGGSMDDENEELDLTPEDVELTTSLDVVFQGE